MVSLTIDGREVSGEEGSTILEVARKNGIRIPTLCYHDAVSSAGTCRLCSVEIVKGSRSRIVASCLYPVWEGLVVRTDTERVINLRKMLIELLLARCPDVKVVQDLAREYGVRQTEFTPEAEDCVLCGLCVRVCDEIVGASAISLVNRGTKREVASPFYEASTACVGCGSCAFVCPTNCIKVEDFGGKRTIKRWHVEFKLARCKACGRYFEPEAHLKFLARELKMREEELQTCQRCRTAQAKISGAAGTAV
jgi:bidirectional [NiFe] hydrogenase diaphorase subunit